MYLNNLLTGTTNTKMMNEEQIKELLEKLNETQKKRMGDVEQLQKVRKEALDKINKIKEEFDFTRGQLDALAGITQQPAPETPPLERETEEVKEVKEVKEETPKED